MKIRKLQSWLASAAGGLLLAGSSGVGLAQTPAYDFTFDNATPWSWVVWWGMGTVAWDGTQDANNNANSGSARFTIPFVGAPGEQIMSFMTWANQWGWDGNTVLDATLYTNLNLSFKVDPGTSPSINGNYGTIEVGFVPSGWDSSKTVTLAYMTLPLSAATSWVSFTNPISPNLSGITAVAGYYLKIWSNGEYTNQFNFNVDNVLLEPIPTNAPPIPPPTMALKATQSGLNFIGLNDGGAYGRFSVYTAHPVYSWLSSPTPVTYSVTIKDYPTAAYQNFQTHLFFVPGNFTAGVTNLPYGPGDGGVDYDAGNVIFVQIANGGGNGAYARFMVKTNQFGGNSMLWGAGTIANLNSTNILGTWSLTFNNSGNVTFTASDGTSTNFSIPAGWVSAFDPGPMYVYFGGQPNATANIGQSTVLGRIQITGSPAPAINDDFTADQALDTTTWGVAASDANGVLLVVPSVTPYWLTWTLPAAHFGLVTSTAVTGPWQDAPFAPVLQMATSSQVLLAKTNFPAATGFLGMVKRVASQLQVLLPGETSAPGTPTGKTGTPDTQTLYNPFNVTVNAVDKNFNVITSVSDNVALSSSDSAAYIPANLTLVGGTATVIDQFYFGTLGTWTITATDVTTNAIAPGTSTPITISQ